MEYFQRQNIMPTMPQKRTWWEVELMQEIKWSPTEKQYQAFEILHDKETTELLYGGGA
jgi:hypothetical protein